MPYSTGVKRDTGLVAGCLTVTAVAWWIVVSQHGAPWWMHGLVITGYSVMAYVVLRRDAQGPAGADTAMSGSVRDAVVDDREAADSVAERMARSFFRWLADTPAGRSWPAFDQFVREVLVDHLGAGHVRCFHVDESGAQTALSRSAEGQVSSVPGDAGLEEDSVAIDHPPDATWVIPGEQRSVGMITIGTLPAPVRARVSLCNTIELLMRDFWLHVAARDALAIAQRTDRSSGVLSREGFFAAARVLFAESQLMQEPVAAVVVAIEGLRRLDDDGHWVRRDRLVAAVGTALAGRLRPDDCIGRFADDRFVLLLRRTDTGLGRLISEKLLGAVEDELIDSGVTSYAQIASRAGLTSTSAPHQRLEDLMSAAFEAVDCARRSGVRVLADSPSRDGATV